MTKRSGGNYTRTVPQSDLENRTLGVGSPVSPDKATGKSRARWSRVDLTGGGGTPGSFLEFDIPHDLGEIPTHVSLETWENAADPATFILATESRRHNWSHSHAHMRVQLVSGSLDGCSAVFKVQGR